VPLFILPGVKMNLDIKHQNSPSFEITMKVRDYNGDLTTQTKSYKTDDPVALERFYVRNSGNQKKKRKRLEAAKKEDVQQIIKSVDKYIDKKDKTNGK